MRRRALAVGLLAVAVAGCGGGHHTSTGAGTTAARTSAPTANPEPAPRLADPAPCPGARGFACSTLAVPLDRSGRVAGTLALRVAVAGAPTAPLGTLVALTGGPGQPGVPFAAPVRARLGPVARRLRIVLVDQRGTGREAVRCPALQAAAGSSDLTVPPPDAIYGCARRLGARRAFFTTADTVADLEALRRALGAPRLLLDGVSYGTYVAERYAIAHPDRVAKLVLDSVVPAAGLDGLEVDGMRESARILRAACRAGGCRTDPATDLAAVVRRRGGGPALYDAIVALSVGAPGYPGVAAALHAAREGRPAALARLVRVVRRAQRVPAGFLSQGLHAATLCADLRPPWGGARAPRAGRATAVARAAARSAPWPFDRATVRGNGLVRTCERWPPTPVPPAPRDGALPPVPTLMLAGDRDLSTPLPWARAQLRLAPRGRLVVVHGAGHSVQSRSRGDEGRRAVASFLRGAG